MPVRILALILAVVPIAGCTSAASEPEGTSAEVSYIEDIESYARDLGGLTTFEVVSRDDMVDFGRTTCNLLGAGGTIRDILLEVFSGYDTSADQPATQEEAVLLTIYAVTAAVDNFCAEHRDVLNEFLEG